MHTQFVRVKIFVLLNIKCQKSTYILFRNGGNTYIKTKLSNTEVSKLELMYYLHAHSICRHPDPVSQARGSISVQTSLTEGVNAPGWSHPTLDYHHCLMAHSQLLTNATLMLPESPGCHNPAIRAISNHMIDLAPK